MECNKDEAIRAKEIAVNKMMNNDFEGARKMVLKAQRLFPELDNISQLLTVCDVHCSAQKKINGAVIDLYGILQVEKSADDATIKRQYRKFALVLHPDKNHFPGAEAAFKLIGEANMILSDKGKRYLHDAKCRDPTKLMVQKPQNRQANQNSHVGTQFGAQSNYSNYAPSSNDRSFWTLCPICKIEFQYLRDVINQRIKCPKCSNLFTANNISVNQSAKPHHSGHAGTQNVNPGSRMGRPVSFQNVDAGKQEKAKVYPQSAESSFTHFAYKPPQSTRTGDAKVGDNVRSKTVENGNTKTKSGKEGVASKETDGIPSVVSDSNNSNIGGKKGSLKRGRASNGEEAVGDLSSEKRSRKSSNDVEEKQKEKVCNTAEGSMPKGKIEEEKDKCKSMGENDHSKSNSDSEDNSEPVYINCPDSEFSNFDKDKEEHCFAADQIWACYDTIDGMPRFYAIIKKVYSSGFKLKITWLEADPENRLEKKWAEEGLPVACGRFKRGDTEETGDRLMFSHKITFDKGNKRYSFVIYPKKGEIWALFKDWDIKWSSDPESHMKYKFDIVEILSDYDKENGVTVAFMVKVEGFVSLFQKTSRARLAEHRIPSSELLRFSHRVPSQKLTGMERPDIPVGSYELDNASLPDDLDQYYISNNVKFNPENVSGQTSNSCPQPPQGKVNDLDRENLNNLRRSPRGLKGKLGQSNGVENKSDTATSLKSSSCQDDDDDVNTKSSSSEKESKIVIHDFNLDKQNWEFKEGQIWAIRASEKGNRRCYAQIKKIESSSSPLRFHVELLELCSDGIRPNACGIYKACAGGRKIIEQDSFLYQVKAEVNGKNRFNIYPRAKEIWVLYNKPDSKCTFSDLDAAGDYDIVEIMENNGDMIKVLCLSCVPDYKSVFRALEIKRVLEIPIADSDKFFYRVPAFLLTEEQDGRLRGSWELDLAEFPGLLPI